MEGRKDKALLCSQPIGSASSMPWLHGAVRADPQEGLRRGRLCRGSYQYAPQPTAVLYDVYWSEPCERKVTGSRSPAPPTVAEAVQM